MSDDFRDFGDAEPEDSWDVDDDPEEQLRNLVRRAILLRRAEAFELLLRALHDLVMVAREDGLEGRDLVRADELEVDIMIVRGRT